MRVQGETCTTYNRSLSCKAVNLFRYMGRKIALQKCAYSSYEAHLTALRGSSNYIIIAFSKTIFQTSNTGEGIPSGSLPKLKAGKEFPPFAPQDFQPYCHVRSGIKVLLIY